jgi:hypothetical protein
LRRLGIFHLPKLKIITIGNLPVKPPQGSDLNQLASFILGAIHPLKFAYSLIGKNRSGRHDGVAE